MQGQKTTMEMMESGKEWYQIPQGAVSRRESIQTPISRVSFWETQKKQP